MNCEVIRIISETEREVWHFHLSASYGTRNLYFDSFSVESKQPKQRIWRTMLHWEHLDKRNNTISEPLLPDDVVKEAKTLIKNQIDLLVVTK